MRATAREEIVDTQGKTSPVWQYFKYFKSYKTNVVIATKSEYDKYFFIIGSAALSCWEYSSVFLLFVCFVNWERFLDKKQNVFCFRIEDHFFLCFNLFFIYSSIKQPQPSTSVSGTTPKETDNH